MPVPPSDIAGPSSVPTAEKEADRVLDGALGVRPPWEEMMEMLRRVPCFTNAEPPSTKMSDFFPLTKWISVNLGDHGNGNLFYFSPFMIMYILVSGTNSDFAISFRVIEAKLKKAEQENDQLKKEMEELRAGLVAKRKEMDELQTRFATQKKELEAEYQNQVDEMYFFDYHRCMKKNGITQDIPSLLSDDEDEVPGGSS
ncbi:hypothetical protein AAG906_003617 [Vitis piasezkii]